MKGNGSGRWNYAFLGQRRICWQWVKHSWLYSDLLQELKGEHFVSFGLSAEGTLIFVSIVPHCVLVNRSVGEQRKADALNCPTEWIFLRGGDSYHFA